MWHFIPAAWLVVGQAAGDGTDVAASLVSYGVAAPLVGFLVWRNKQDREDRDKAMARADTLTDRLLEQQERLVPIATEMTATLKAAAAQVRPPT